MTEVAVLRPALTRDADGIARVHVETWQSTYAGLVPTDYLARMTVARASAQWHRAAAQAEKGNDLMVAEVDEEIVGFVSFGPSRSKEQPYSGEVFALYITVDWQGQGLGRRLLATAFEALAKEGHRGAFVWVLAENPSRFFYQAMGGEHAGERMEKFAGVALEELAYGWPDLESWLAQSGV
ncbi:GNAT family N-acetyltransferase [Pelagibius litoralis]|uniref:GNAT family N-acetyltransferase n=1 Tax=Pelagibius litoralis TaxID=374515 RepID=A0A967EZM2_9PROT|nr:GNAT family N-acetyltransferase [Pelagibius litoralis]NIA70330.1 GNAT family N-acetyltransferase [Pelagibius litoralis]